MRGFLTIWEPVPIMDRASFRMRKHWHLSRNILTKLNINLDTKANDLTDEEISKIRKELDNHLLEGDLRREVSMNIKTKMEIGSYQGIRHRKGLPVRGQSTRSNARTRKGRGKTVANKKK